MFDRLAIERNGDFAPRMDGQSLNNPFSI